MATEGHSNELYQQALLRVGSTLRGKWRIDALIGVGGMASVYAATHRNGHRVAIKVLHPALALTTSVRERFLREGYAANNVDHPGIARILDDDEAEDGSSFLVMELLSGETLDTRWRRAAGRMAPGEALAVAHGLLDVLEAAHTAGVLHRDIKPENIFLTTGGQVKLLDFGIARVREQTPGSPSVTRTGAMLGTPAFMSPEQARGRAREVDGRSDLWAVGATLFTILTGRYVHTGETANEILIKTATETAPSLAVALPDAPPALVAVVDRALAFSLGDRWPSAAAMRQATEEALAALGLPLEMPRGDANARPASFPDVVGATVESAPPCAEPPPEGTPGPTELPSLPPSLPAASYQRFPRLPAAIGVALAAAAAIAMFRPGGAPPPPAPVAAAAPSPPPAPAPTPLPEPASSSPPTLAAESLPHAPPAASSSHSTSASKGSTSKGKSPAPRSSGKPRR